MELLTNDIGIAPIIEDRDDDKKQQKSNNIDADDDCNINDEKNNKPLINKFQVYIGGGQGQQAGKPTFCNGFCCLVFMAVIFSPIIPEKLYK